MPRGPAKQFDPTAALERAMELFWIRGFSATSMAEIRAATGLGAKSLYDTFGNKRALYLQAIDHYIATVVDRLYGRLATDASPATAVAGLLPKIARLNASDHRGCLLGVAMAAEIKVETPRMGDLSRCHPEPLQGVVNLCLLRTRR